MYNEIIILLQSLILNYPLLIEMGLALSLPLLLSVSDNVTKQGIIKALSPCKSKYISIHDKNDPLDLLQNLSSEPIFVDVSGADKLRSNRLVDRLESILTSVTGNIGEFAVGCVPILITTDGIPRMLKNRVLYLSVELPNILKINFERLIPLPTEFSLIQSRVLEDTEYADAEPALLAAAYCVYPMARTETDKESLRNLREVALQITEKSRCFDNPEGLSELFKSEFYAWLNANNNYSGYFLPNLQQEAEKEMDSAFFFQKQNIYISQVLFRRISHAIIKTVGESALKDALEETGILITEEGAKSSRMYYRLHDQNRNVRMLKFNKENLDSVLNASIEELCFGQKGGN